MLTSMKVRNFLCFDYFKFNFIQDQSSILVIGENGVGKTLIGKILFIFNRIASQGNSFTLWELRESFYCPKLDKPSVIRIEGIFDNKEFVYILTFSDIIIDEYIRLGDDVWSRDEYIKSIEMDEEKWTRYDRNYRFIFSDLMHNIKCFKLICLFFHNSLFIGDQYFQEEPYHLLETHYFLRKDNSISLVEDMSLSVSFNDTMTLREAIDKFHTLSSGIQQQVILKWIEQYLKRI